MRQSACSVANPITVNSVSVGGLAVQFSSCFNSVLLDLDLYDCCFDA